MRIDGTLTKWNEDRGFGFIAPIKGGPEMFVHISAFPKDGRRPFVGEQLTFEVETDTAGKSRATNLLCPNRPVVRTVRQHSAKRRSETHGIFGGVISVAVVIAIGLYVYSEVSSRVSSQNGVANQIDNQNISSTFSCDGRTHCSQMSSCAEATFFLRNCPNVEMDGNGDGVPCEQQWCTSPFAK